MPRYYNLAVCIRRGVSIVSSAILYALTFLAWAAPVSADVTDPSHPTATSSASAPEPSSNEALVAFLRSYLEPDPPGDFYAPTRIEAALVRSSAGEEWIVYVRGGIWCGSGGCTMLVLAPHGSSFTVIGRTTIVLLPIRRLASESHGRPDIGVMVKDGVRTYESLLSFDGTRYPINPSVPPAPPFTGPSPGEVIIPDPPQLQLVWPAVKGRGPSHSFGS